MVYEYRGLLLGAVPGRGRLARDRVLVPHDGVVEHKRDAYANSDTDRVMKMDNKVAWWTGVIYRICNDAERDGDAAIARELRDFLTQWLRGKSE